MRCSRFMLSMRATSWALRIPKLDRPTSCPSHTSRASTRAQACDSASNSHQDSNNLLKSRKYLTTSSMAEKSTAEKVYSQPRYAIIADTVPRLQSHPRQRASSTLTTTTRHTQQAKTWHLLLLPRHQSHPNPAFASPPKPRRSRLPNPRDR